MCADVCICAVNLIIIDGNNWTHWTIIQTLRPKSTDFEVIDDLGEGNFSKIFKVSLKLTGDIYAMKVRSISKSCIQRSPLQHPVPFCMTVSMSLFISSNPSAHLSV